MFPIGALLEVGGKILDRVIPDPAAKAQAQAALMEMQQKGELAQIQADMAEQAEVSKRWEADMKSDSWLSKNIRPMTLIYILVIYTLFAGFSAVNVNVNQAYVELMGQWGMLIMSAYFGGRTLEKIMGSKKDKESKDATDK